MARLPKLWSNTAANAAAQVLPVLLSLVAVPVYVRFVGLEGYGLVGFFAALTAVLAVFSAGLGGALQREVSRRAAEAMARGTLARLFRTFEILFLGLGLGLALVLGAAAWAGGAAWVRAETISPAAVRLCLVLIALRIAAAFPHSVYLATLMGLERQVTAALINSLIPAAGVAVGVAAVAYTRSVVALYLVDVATVAAMLAWSRRAARRVLPSATAPARFDGGEVRALGRFAAGLGWTHGIGALITQVDRLAIGSLLPIASLAPYNAGSAGGRLVGMANAPFLNAAYPETCRLARRGPSAALSAHVVRNLRASLAVAVAVAAPLMVFAGDLLLVWTRSEVIAREGRWIMAIYTAGNLLLAVAAVFYMAQLALGCTRLSVYFNTAALGWYPLLMVWAVRREGLPGAAATWLAYCALVAVYLGATTCARFAPGAAGPALRSALLAAAVAAAACAAGAGLAHAAAPGAAWARIVAAGASGAATLAALFGVWFVRPRARRAAGAAS